MHILNIEVFSGTVMFSKYWFTLGTRYLCLLKSFSPVFCNDFWALWGRKWYVGPSLNKKRKWAKHQPSFLSSKPWMWVQYDQPDAMSSPQWWNGSLNQDEPFLPEFAFDSGFVLSIRKSANTVIIKLKNQWQTLGH